MTTHSQSRQRAQKKGFGIVVVLTFAAILAVFTAAIGAQTASNLHAAEKNGQTDEAHYAALTGVHVSLGYLFDPKDADGNPSTDWLLWDRSVRIKLRDRTIAAAHLYHNIQGFEGSREKADDGTVIPPDHFYIISVGEVNAVYGEDGEVIGGTRVKQNTMGSLIAPDFPVMPYAMFGFDKVFVNGDVTHFDSKAGFTPAVGPSGDHMDCAYPDASIATRMSQAGAIELGDDARVDGHAILGFESSELHAFASAYPLASPPQVEPDPIPAFGPKQQWAGGSDHERLNGVVSRLGVDKSPRKILLPDNATPLGSNLHVNYTQKLTSGTNYYVQGDLTVTSSGRLIVEPMSDGEFKDVVIYVDGNITFAGATDINRNAPPGRLKIYSLASSGSSEFRMTDSKAFCLVAGNNLNVIISGASSELWGAVMGSSVRLESGKIHYDTQLRDPMTLASAYGFTILSNSSLPHLADNVTSVGLAPPGSAPGAGGTTGGTSGGGIGTGATGTTGGTTGTTGGETGTTGGTTGTTGGETGTTGGTTGTTGGETGTTGGTTGTTGGETGTTGGTTGTTGTTAGTGTTGTSGTTGTTGGGGGGGGGGGSMEMEQKQML